MINKSRSNCGFLSTTFMSQLILWLIIRLIFIAESTVRLSSDSSFPNLCLHINKIWTFYSNSRINYTQKIITFPIRFKHAHLIWVPKRKLHENPAIFSYKGTLQLSIPSHTTHVLHHAKENFTEIQQVKIEVVNMPDSGSAR